MENSQIWLNYRSNLKAFLHSKVSNPSDVDDLLQEILIKAYTNLHQVSSTNNVKSWLFQITNNTIMDYYRLKNKSNSLQSEELWYSEDDPDLQQSLSDCVLPLINALPASSAELLNKIDIQGMSQKEYAKEHRIDYSTLKSRVQKSRILLRNLFEECCVMSFDKNGGVIDYFSKSNSCSKC